MAFLSDIVAALKLFSSFLFHISFFISLEHSTTLSSLFCFSRFTLPTLSTGMQLSEKK